MRACTNCGDWVGDANTSCPKCGSAIVAAAPAVPAVPTRPEWAPPAPPTPTYATWQEPRPRRKRSLVTRLLLWSIGVIVGLAAVAFGIAVYQAVVNGTPPELDGYVHNAKGVTFAPAGAHFSVRFPTDPIPLRQSVPVGARDLQVYGGEATRRTYTMTAGEIAIPSDLLNNFDVDAGTRGAATGGANAIGLQESVPASITTAQGFPGYVLHGKTPAGDVIYIETFFTRGRIYMLAVGTHYGSPEALKAFEKSFQLQ